MFKATRGRADTSTHPQASLSGVFLASLRTLQPAADRPRLLSRRRLAPDGLRQPIEQLAHAPLAIVHVRRDADHAESLGDEDLPNLGGREVA